MQRTADRRFFIVATLVCQFVAGSFVTLDMAYATGAESVTQPAHCHDTNAAPEPADGSGHPCGCDGAECKCACVQLTPLALGAVVVVPSRAHTAKPEPARPSPIVFSNNSLFRPPI